MAFAAAATALNNRQRFKNFFRTLPQLYEFLSAALVQISLQFEWRQMAVITQTENLFTKVIINSLYYTYYYYLTCMYAHVLIDH